MRHNENTKTGFWHEPTSKELHRLPIWTIQSSVLDRPLIHTCLIRTGFGILRIFFKIFFSFWSAIRDTTLGLDHGLSGRQS